MDKDPQHNYYDEYEIDLREYILLLWDNKFFIGGLVILAVILSYTYTISFIKPNYQNSLTVQLANTEGVYSETEAMNELLKSDELVSSALEKEDLESTAVNNLSTDIVSNLRLTERGMQGAVYGGIIRLNAESAESEKLYLALNAIIDEFEMRSNNYFADVLEEKNEELDKINEEIEILNKEINKTNEILNRLEDVSIDDAFIIANINDKLNTLSKTKRDYLNDHQELKREIEDHQEFRVLNFPSRSGTQTSPNIKLNIAIAAVLAFMLAVFIVFFKEFMKEE